MALDDVAMCGLYCGLCASRRRIPGQAAALRESLRAEGYDWWYKDVPGLAEAFPAFWGGLERLAKTPCPGCRAEGGNPGCQIRPCVRERRLMGCPLCDEFPCAKLDVVCAYPTLETDGRRMREGGRRGGSRSRRRAPLVEPTAEHHETRAEAHLLASPSPLRRLPVNDPPKAQ